MHIDVEEMKKMILYEFEVTFAHTHACRSTGLHNNIETMVNYKFNESIVVCGLSSAGRTGGRHILAVHAKKCAAEQHGHSTGQVQYWWQCVYYGLTVTEPGPTYPTSPCNAEKTTI